MNKIFTIISILFFVLNVSAQSFEGKITYNNSFTSKNPQITDHQWSTMMGTTQDYFIKEGSYKSITNGTLMQWQLYNNLENRLYNKMSNSESALWNDASIQGDEVLKIEVHKNVTQILGFPCDEVILTCKSGVQKYYFNTKLAVDVKLFTNHKFGNWFDFLNISKALPLKLINETAQFRMESIATNVKPMTLDASLFQLPNGMKTEKNPY